MYYFSGALTVAWGIALYFFLLPHPVRAKGFSERERYIMVARLRSNNSCVRNTHLKAGQIRELLLDPKFWLMFFAATLSMIANGKSTADTTVTHCLTREYRSNLDFRPDHNFWLWIQQVAVTLAGDASWSIWRDHDAYLPISGIQVPEQTSLPVLHCRDIDSDRCRLALGIASERKGRPALCMLYLALSRSRLRRSHGSADSEHCWIHKTYGRLLGLVRRLLPR